MSNYTIITKKQDIYKNDGSNIGAASQKVFGPFTYEEARQHLKAFADQNAEQNPHGTYAESDYVQVDQLNGSSRVATRIVAEIIRNSHIISLHS